MSGCSSPVSASPRTAPSVRNTASTAPRKSVPNIAKPSIVAPASVWASRPTSFSPKPETSLNSSLAPQAYRPPNTSVSTTTTTKTRRRSDSRTAWPATTRTSRIAVALDHGQVGVLERGAHKAHVVDALASGDQALDDGRHVVARRLAEAPRPV